MKKFLIFTSLLVTAYSLFSLATWYLSDGFSLAKIHSHLQFSPHWDVKTEPIEEILPLLEQNFYYVGHGSQCFAFESEDKQIILKFFRLSRYQLPQITQFITRPRFLAEIQKAKKELKQKKLENLFQSCKIAYQDLREETGLIYLHLNKTAFINKTVLLYDKLKRTYPVDLDNYAFVLQMQGEHIFPYLTRLIEKGKNKEAKEALLNLVTIHLNRLNKGIFDRDVVLHKNSGFYGTKAFFLDIGEFSKQVCENPYQELREMTDHLRYWLYKKDEELAHYFENLIHTVATGQKAAYAPLF